MRQTTTSLALPIPAFDSHLAEARIDAIAASQAAIAAIPCLHFFSLQVFGPAAGVPAGGDAVTPLCVLEANIDGPPGPFWAKLEAVLGEDLRNLLRACRSPARDIDPLYAAVIAPFSAVPIAPLLARCALRPAAVHRGNRGLSRLRINRHDALFGDVQTTLASGQMPAGLDAAGLRGWLRTQMLPRHPWLDDSWEPRIAFADCARDWLRAALFLLANVAAMALPWWCLSLWLGFGGAAVAVLLTGAAATMWLQDIGDLPPLFGLQPIKNLWFYVAMLHLAAAAWLLWHGSAAHGAVAPGGVRHFLAGAAGLALAAFAPGGLVLLAALRWHERRLDIPPDAQPDPAHVRALQSWEDSRPDGADHMASVVLLKPGLFWALILRLGFTIVDIFVQITGKGGYLGLVPANFIMRTIHFAHWAYVDRGQRLMFLSNFDGSWENYLDDFIDKEHSGLTLAWSCGLGFPPARYLQLDGASKGRQFKAWARQSMTVTRLHVAAYPALTVNQIVRQARLAKGLAAPRMGKAMAAHWAKDL